MIKTSSPLIISVGIATFLCGLAAGYATSPYYQQSMFDKNVMTTTGEIGTPGRFFDKHYIDMMAAHHRGAILLAEQMQEGLARPEIASLAKAIINNEPALINQLYVWKKAWYNDQSTASDPRVPDLSPADETRDLRFLNVLIAHHEDGIRMAREARTKSTRSEIVTDAYGVEQFLIASMKTLKEWRSQWYGL